jgi:hypothetical protein
MPIPVNAILTRASLVLNDEEFVRWTQVELIDWLNDCAAAIIIRRPAAFALAVNFAMAAGTKQELLAGMVQLLDVVRNIKAGGLPGRPIGMVDRKLLDDAEPDWHSAKPSATISNYTHDLRVPRTFYVYPPASAGQLIEILTAALPTTVTTIGDQFGIGAEYIEAIVHYLCYRALSKDSEYGQGQMAAAYFSAFQDSLGTQGQAAQATAPESASV